MLLPGIVLLLFIVVVTHLPLFLPTYLLLLYGDQIIVIAGRYAFITLTITCNGTIGDCVLPCHSFIPIVLLYCCCCYIGGIPVYAVFVVTCYPVLLYCDAALFPTVTVRVLPRPVPLGRRYSWWFWAVMFPAGLIYWPCCSAGERHAEPVAGALYPDTFVLTFYCRRVVHCCSVTLLLCVGDLFTLYIYHTDWWIHTIQICVFIHTCIPFYLNMHLMHFRLFPPLTYCVNEIYTLPSIFVVTFLYLLLCWLFFTTIRYTWHYRPTLPFDHVFDQYCIIIDNDQYSIAVYDIILLYYCVLFIIIYLFVLCSFLYLYMPNWYGIDLHIHYSLHYSFICC